MHDHLMHSGRDISHIADVVFELRDILHRLNASISDGGICIDIPSKERNLQIRVLQIGEMGNLCQDRIIH